MKQTIILFFAIITAFPVYCQTYLQDGDRCLDNADYTCAVTKYNEVFKSASGKDKQLAEIKLIKAKNCIEWIKIADQEFKNRRYREAKENYQKVFDSNPKDMYAKTQLKKCNNALNPYITLSVSIANLLFSSSGGSKNITVTTNAGSYSINALPSWCTIQKYAGYFVIACRANTGNAARTDYFTIHAGDKTVRINISQSGEVQKQETTLSVTKEILSFSSSGGRSEAITVYSNANTYSISDVPSWCSVQAYNGYFVVSCDAINSTQSRSDWFEVVAGDQEVKIYVNQAGSPHISTQSKTRKYFNCPNTKYKWGFSLGYVEKKLDHSIMDYDYNNDYYYYSKLEGVQIGLRFEPLFKYGFGLNTGIFYEHYAFNLFDEDYYGDYEEHVLSIPFHLEYRLNLSQYFNMFIYGGASADMITDSIFENYSFQSSFDYGGGIRIDHLQINIEQNRKKNKSTDLIISCSYMF
jgi:hypothetical protein